MGVCSGTQVEGYMYAILIIGFIGVCSSMVTSAKQNREGEWSNHKIYPLPYTSLLFLFPLFKTIFSKYKGYKMTFTLISENTFSRLIAYKWLTNLTNQFLVENIMIIKQFLHSIEENTMIIYYFLQIIVVAVDWRIFLEKIRFFSIDTSFIDLLNIKWYLLHHSMK